MNSDTTPTPRFDALREQTSTYPRCTAIDYFEDFSQQLERELTEKTNEVARFRDELQDIKDGMKFIMDEKCAESEVHCGCVPLLKISFKKSEEEVGRLRELLNRAIEIADNYEIAGLPRDGFMLHWKVNKHEFSMLKEKIRLAPAPEEPTIKESLKAEPRLGAEIEVIDTPATYSVTEARHATADAIRYLRDEIQKLKEGK